MLYLNDSTLSKMMGELQNIKKNIFVKFNLVMCLNVVINHLH